MASNRIETRIESLLAASEWESAQKVVTKQSAREPDDHWLWSRLSGVKYERRDYQGALEATDQRLELLPRLQDPWEVGDLLAMTVWMRGRWSIFARLELSRAVTLTSRSWPWVRK